MRCSTPMRFGARTSMHRRRRSTRRRGTSPTAGPAGAACSRPAPAVRAGPLGQPGLDRQLAGERPARGPRAPAPSRRRRAAARPGTATRPSAGPPSSPEYAHAVSTSRPRSDSTPAMRANAPGTVVAHDGDPLGAGPPSASASSGSMRTSSRPAAIVASVACVGEAPARRAAQRRRRRAAWRVRATRSATSCSFHEPHADGPVASESASVSACSRSSVLDVADRVGDLADRRRVGRGRAARRRRAAAGGAGPSARASSTSSAARPRRGPIGRTSSMPAVGVVARVALAEVVEQRAEHEQVGPLDPVGERGGVGRRLPQVPVDGEAVVGVALRAAAHRRPLRQQAHEDAALVERLEHVDRPVPLAEQGDQLVDGAVGPALAPTPPASTSAASRSSVGAGQPDVALGGDARRPQHEHRDRRPRSAAAGQLDLAVDDDEPVADALLVADLVARARGATPRRRSRRCCGPAAATSAISSSADAGAERARRRRPGPRGAARRRADPSSRCRATRTSTQRAVAAVEHGEVVGRHDAGRRRPPTTACARRAARRGRP